MSANLDEQLFLEKIAPCFNGLSYPIPRPKSPPTERHRRRLAFRNQIYVYPRQSAFSGRNVISMFYPETPFGVIENDLWFGDGWSGLDFAQSFDASAPVFSQIERLRNRVPHLARSALFNENCDFASNLAHCKNCYLVFNSTHVEDSMYGENLWRSKDCLDCAHLSDCELCYDCLLCDNCYNLQCSWDCENCSESLYLLGCRACSNCFGCVNLSRKDYHIYNQPVTKTDYRAFISSLNLSSRVERERLSSEIGRFWRRHPRPHVHVKHAENADGNYLFHSKDLEDCFFVRDGESLAHCSFLYGGAKDCRDFSFVGLNCELMYECAWCALNSRLCLFCFWCLQCQDMLYCWHCIGCKNCFGCAGLRNQQYCLFNKQLSREEYERSVPEVIALMERTGEWGEFFPISMSGVPYNHSMAQRFFPLTKEEAAASGYPWYDKPLVSCDAGMDVSVLPDSPPDTDEPLIVKSRRSSSAFRITSEEQRRGRFFRAPLPVEAYDERLTEKAMRLGVTKLFERRCPKTGATLFTSYPPDSEWIVWHRDACAAEET